MQLICITDSDGTLITQRLHFAPMPHHHRHVLGWHRILTELKECDVRAICVFDGQERSAAKAREASLAKRSYGLISNLNCITGRTAEGNT